MLLFCYLTHNYFVNIMFSQKLLRNHSCETQILYKNKIDIWCFYQFSVVYATSAYLYVYFYVRHKSLSNIQEFMNSRFLYRTDDAPEQLTMERYVKVVKRMLFAIDVFVFITGGSMLIAPFLSHTKERYTPPPILQKYRSKC